MRFFQGNDADIGPDEDFEIGEEDDDFDIIGDEELFDFQEFNTVGLLFKIILSLIPTIDLIFWYFNIESSDGMHFSSYLVFQEHKWYYFLVGIFNVGPPDLDNWILAIFFFICVNFPLLKSSYCAMAFLHSTLGAYILYFISPFLYIAPKIFIIYSFIVLKTNSTKILRIYDELGFGAAWFPFLYVIFSFWRDSRKDFLYNLFMLVWAHIFYFFDVIVPQYTSFHITKPPKIIEKLFEIQLFND